MEWHPTYELLNIHLNLIERFPKFFFLLKNQFILIEHEHAYCVRKSAENAKLQIKSMSNSISSCKKYKEKRLSNKFNGNITTEEQLINRLIKPLQLKRIQQC